MATQKANDKPVQICSKCGQPMGTEGRTFICPNCGHTLWGEIIGTTILALVLVVERRRGCLD